MSRVFVVQESPNINLSPAFDYGDEMIEVVPKGNHSFFPGKLRNSIELKLESHGFCADDYLLLVGDPVVILMVGIAAKNMVGEQNLKVLKWDRQDHRYLPLEL